MLDDELLFSLLPAFAIEPTAYQAGDVSEAARWISSWSDTMREALRQELVESGEQDRLGRLVRSSAFIGAGIRRVSSSTDLDLSLPVVRGYQLGIVLFRGAGTWQDEREYRAYEPDYLRVPGGYASVTQVVAEFRPHNHVGSPEGRIAAYFEDGDGRVCGLTAGHAVLGRGPGQLTGVVCEHGAATQLQRRAPGLIDSAVVRCACPGSVRPVPVRRVVEGEQVTMHFEPRVRHPSTVVMGLQTAPELMSAAVPMHFVTSDFGSHGNSGSLIATASDRNLGGIYLGSTVCRDKEGQFAEYGYGLDLNQAAIMLGVTQTMGEVDD